ncbi:hypothetical protein FRC04_000824 [Tulasnella sp. 424]|nr:hypothetical protein FRC04_000824 [Tulasnella sp. 424]
MAKYVDIKMLSIAEGKVGAKSVRQILGGKDADLEELSVADVGVKNSRKFTDVRFVPTLLQTAVRSRWSGSRAAKVALPRGCTRTSHQIRRSFNASCNIPEPPKYKATKITLEQLYDIFDTNYVETSIRYGSLRITSPNINVKWNKESGEFSLSGTYGL